MKEIIPGSREQKRKTLLDSVESIRDIVEEGSDEAEEIRTLPKAAVDALESSGLFGLKLPESLGGSEADPVTQLEVIEALTKIDTSAGWSMMIGATSAALPGAFLADEAIDVIFAGGRAPRFAGSGMPGGEAIQNAGGYTVNGRWSFASGVLHSEWSFAGILIPRGGDERPDFQVMVFPTSQAQIHDDWHAAGLKGTGSCDFSVTDIFVSEEFMWDPLNQKPKRGGPLYRIPPPGFVTNEHAGFALGAGRRALDEVVELAKTKRRGGLLLLAERPSFQKAIGECDLKLRAARSLAIESHEEAWERVCADEEISRELLAELRGSATLATDAALYVAAESFRFAGAEALYSSNVLQRCLRDITAASQHYLMSNTAYEIQGQVVLGMTDVNPLG